MIVTQPKEPKPFMHSVKMFVALWPYLLPARFFGGGYSTYGPV